MKNIEILSMQQIDNYGSVLQAYSLKKIIEGLGNKVTFIGIKKGENNLLNLQCNQGDIDKNQDRWLKTQCNRIKNKITSRKQKKIFSDFRAEVGLNSLSTTESFDVCVIGSDEVFNCLQKSKWGFSPQLFGDIKSAKKVITYAASCGFTKEEALTSDLKDSIKKAMNNLSAISVRDNNTAEFVQKLTGKEVIYNLDPVAIGNFEKEMENIKLDSKFPFKYCIVYSYNKRINAPEEISEISYYCQKNNLNLVAPFGKQTWIPSCKPLTPFELLKAFENAECIITDTFHGALFGAKFGKRMAILIRQSNRNKLDDLVKRLEIQDHVVANISQLSEILDKPLNKKNIQKILKDERIRTLKYLQTNL